MFRKALEFAIKITTVKSKGTRATLLYSFVNRNQETEDISLIAPVWLTLGHEQEWREADVSDVAISAYWQYPL